MAGPLMFVGLDSFAYHRYFGETSQWEQPISMRWSYVDFLKRASELGVQGVSLQTVYLPEQDKRLIDCLREELDQRNLDRVVAWGHRRGLADGTDPQAYRSMILWMDRAALLGCAVIRIVCGDQYSSRQPASERIQRLVPLLRQAASRARRLGLNIAIENHADLRSEELVSLIQSVGASNVGVCLDSGNAVRIGEDLLEATRRLGPLTTMVHVKDLKVLEESRGDPTASWPSAPLGDGTLDIAAFVSTLRDCNYDGGLFIEMAHMHPNWPDEDSAVAGSVMNLRRVLEAQRG
jgi:sugar phosphate isomerase/epimerase